MMRPRLLLAPMFLALLGPTLLRAQTWSPVGSGCGSFVYTLEEFGGQLYAGGTFTDVGDLNTNYIARWNGSTWGSIGGLITYQTSDCFHAHDTALYIGDAGRVRRWDGNAWGTTLPGVFNSAIYGIAHFDGMLYVGGFFSSQNSQPYPHVARWNGTAYDTLTSGCNAQVTDLEPFNGQLFVGGDFTVAGDSLISHTALWDGEAWHRMGNGVNDDVYAHCIYHDTLYIGGRFTQANGQPASHVAKWNGSQWVSVGGPLNDYVGTMHVYHDQLYIGGAFTTPAYIARLAGHSWVPVGGGCDDKVRTLEVYHDSLFVGGQFTQAGGQPAAHIAKWYLPALPVAAMSVGTSVLCAGSCTTFMDASSNAVDTWSWSFPGGTPSTSTVAAPHICYSDPGTYGATLTVSNPGGSSSFTLPDAVTVEVCTGVVENTPNASALIASPNPATASVRIVRSDGKALGALRVLDLMGRMVITTTIASTGHVLDLGALPAGVYVVQVADLGAVRVVRSE